MQGLSLGSIIPQTHISVPNVALVSPALTLYVATPRRENVVGAREVDVARCVWPVLVMLTTYARQAHQFSVLWRDVVERSVGADLDMFVAVFAELARNLTGDGMEGLPEEPRKLLG